MVYFKIFSLLITLFFSTISLSQELAIVAVGEANIEADRLFIPNAIVRGGMSSEGQQVVSILRNNFKFYRKRFNVQEGTSQSGAQYTDWTRQGHRFVIQFSLNDSSYNLNVYDVTKRSEILSYSGQLSGNIRAVAHDLAHRAYKEMTGQDSIFKSQIVFVSDHDAQGAEIKELYIMDFDGQNRRRLTHHRGTVISPAVSHDGSRILYSLIEGGKHERNVNLLMLDMNTGKSEVISKRPGINSGAVFMPDNQSILMTLSHTGQADLYVMNLASGNLRRITNHHSPDVDPSINRDGSLMTFLSGRSGSAMIYTMSPMGTELNPKRISFVGQYNATPRFSPDGSEIAFSSWLDNRFDIFRIGADGHNLVRLTKDFGSNEDPTYSPDGQFIAFTSQRVLSRTSAVQNIYIMDRDGEILGSITDGFGNCISPRWSKY
jgi:TolB protein